MTCVRLHVVGTRVVMFMKYGLVCVPALHGFEINANKIIAFLCVVVNVNNGNKKEEKKKRSEISDVRSIQNIGTSSYKQYAG